MQGLEMGQVDDKKALFFVEATQLDITTENTDTLKPKDIAEILEFHAKRGVLESLNITVPFLNSDAQQSIVKCLLNCPLNSFVYRCDNATLENITNFIIAVNDEDNLGTLNLDNCIFEHSSELLLALSKYLNSSHRLAFLSIKNHKLNLDEPFLAAVKNCKSLIAIDGCDKLPAELSHKSMEAFLDPKILAKEIDEQSAESPVKAEPKNKNPKRKHDLKTRLEIVADKQLADQMVTPPRKAKGILPYYKKGEEPLKKGLRVQRSLERSVDDDLAKPSKPCVRKLFSCKSS